MTIQSRFFKHRFLHLLSVLALTVLATGLSSAQTRSLTQLDAYIKNAMQDWRIPGLAIAIVKDGQVIHERGFGTRTLGKNQPVDENTLFAIASNTKAFTATAIGLLVQDGKASWDNPVLKWMPDFQMYDPVVTRKICIRDLLCHRAGLGLWAGDLTWWNSTYDKDEVIRRIRFQKPACDFRTEYHYTNLMFLVAGEIIPHVTDLSWSQFIQQRLFEPLEMNRSTTSITDLTNLSNVATPHSLIDNHVAAVSYTNMNNCRPAGAINSSVHDMSHWMQLQLNNGVYKGKTIVKPEIIRETRKPHNLMIVNDGTKKLNPYTHFSAYALGLRLHDYRGRFVVNHTGGLDGMLSYFGFMPDENFGVIVMTNYDEHGFHRVLPLYVFDLMLGVDEKDWSQVYLDDFKARQERNEKALEDKWTNRAEGTQPSHTLEAYAGTYTSKVYGEAKISLENEELKLRLSAHPDCEAVVKHWHYDTFQARWNNRLWRESYVYFKLNGRGEITNFLMSIRPDWVDTLEYDFVKNN